jgi:hypothetical protein
LNVSFVVKEITWIMIRPLYTTLRYISRSHDSTARDTNSQQEGREIEEFLERE